MLITFTILCGLWLYTLMSYLSLNILLKYKDGERLIIYVLNTSLAFICHMIRREPPLYLSHDSQGVGPLSVTWFTGSRPFICHMIYMESPLYLSHDSQVATPLSVTWFTGRGLADQVVSRLLTSDLKPNYSLMWVFSWYLPQLLRLLTYELLIWVHVLDTCLHC